MVLKKGTVKEEGSGLSFVLCRYLVARNQGELRVKSVIGGAAFSFTLLGRQ